MGIAEILVVILIGAAVLGVPLLAITLASVAIHRTRQLKELHRRLQDLEARMSSPRASTARDAETDFVAAEVVTESSESQTVAIDQALTTDASVSEITDDSTGWETFIGQKAFGWLAVVLFIFGAAFFLRYAYQNNWIGPIGRVAMGELVGAALVFAGCLYHRQGWQRFSIMLSAAGIIVLYLATYSAFGFYHLLPQQHAGAFLVVLVMESMILAVVYRSAILALVAVIGGLCTPLLMHTDRDTYTAFFTYLTALNVGVVLVLLLRSWPAVGSVSYLGTQALFWMWYGENYHTEKFAWALGFQVVLFGLYLGHSILAARLRRQNADVEELARFVVNAIGGFGALYVLTKVDYRDWLGTAAICMATLYAGVGRVALAWRPQDNRLLLTSLAVAVGFVAWAFPIQAEARWVAFGWSVMAASLWWFGLRISAPPLRAMSGVLGVFAVSRLLWFNLPIYTREPFIPILNGFALPSLGVAVCILISVLVAGRFESRLHQAERFLVACAGVSGVSLIWLILSFDCYGYFESQSIGTDEAQLWRWRGQLALTVMWTLFASILLILGFRLKRVRLRWMAIALYGITVMKLFMVDMANVQQLYRILAFFVLAIVLGLVARVYQRFR